MFIRILPKKFPNIPPKKMIDKSKTKKQLLSEIKKLSRQLGELTKSGRVCTLQEKQCRELIRKGKDVLFTLDPEGNVTSINAIAKKIAGYKQEELIGKNFRTLVTEQTKKKTEEDFSRMLKKGEITTEITLLGKKGKPCFFDCNVKTIKKGKKITEIKGVVRDITKYKQIEDDLQETKRQIEFVLGSTKTGLDIIDSNFNIRYIDPEWQKVYGNHKGKKCYKYFMGRKRVCPNCSITKAFATKKPVVSEEILIKENNRPIQVTTMPFQAKDGEWLVAEVNVDITERKRLENILQESEGKFRGVVDNIAIGVSLISPNMEILALNKKMKEWFPNIDANKKLVCYKAFNNPPSETICSYCPTYKTLNDGQIHESITETPAGDKIINYRVVSSPVINNNGQIVAAIEMVEDITKRKQSEEALRISEKKIRAIFDQTFQFIGLMTVDGKLIEANRTAMHFAGINESDCLGKPFWDTPWWTHSKEMQNKLREAVKRALSGETVLFEATHLAADKSLHYIDFSLKPIKDEDGKVVFLIPEGHDITERKQSEEQLKKYQTNLEELVEERTKELQKVNKQIRQDVISCNLMSQEISESEKRYRELWDNAPVAYHTLDMKGIITNVNKTEVKLLGYKTEEMIGKSIFDFILPEQKEEAEKRFQQKLSGKRISRAESRIYIRKDGSKIYVSIDDAFEYDSNGKIVGIKTTMVDFTENKKMEEALRESESQYRTTINSMRDAINVVDADLRIILCNNALQEWLGALGFKTDLMGKKLFDVLPFLSDNVRNEYNQVFESGEILVTEERLNLGGKEWVTEIRKIPIWEAGKVIRILTIIRDVTERRKTEETIRYLAYYDTLTNLPNRTLFNNRLALELSRAQRNKQKVSVMMLDLDKFKNVNDSLGHSFGDQLLQDVAKRLSETVRSSDTVSRMGGDEFILLLPEITSGENITIIAEKILETIRKPFLINNQKLQITTSIGISIYPVDGEDAETLIKNADIAMYQAKQTGRDRYSQHKTDSK